jgi:predicted DNA-binding ribbon-helix-helix protein
MRKHSLIIAGHATSVSLEQEFWDILKEIADRRGIALSALIMEVDAERKENLSSALRLYVLRMLKGQLASNQEE